LYSTNHSCSVAHDRLRTVPLRTSGLTTASSCTDSELALNAGVSFTRQSFGLNAASPWNRSNDTVVRLENTNCPGRPKKSVVNGRSVLSNGVVAVGIIRPSNSVLLSPVTLRNVCCPMIG
jgi:hypothetical protein